MNGLDTYIAAAEAFARADRPEAPDLAGVVSSRCLARAARLYAVVLDPSGHAGPRHFLAELPEGAAVFRLAAAGVRFLLQEHGAPQSEPLLREAPVDARAVEAWYGALLSAPGLAHGDPEALPLAAGERQIVPAGGKLTARHVVWLQAEAPVLFYPALAGMEASAPRTRLILANQIKAELAGEAEVAAIDTAALAARLPPDELGDVSTLLAARIAAALIRRDEAQRRRWQQAREVDEAGAMRALRRLRDVAALRRPPPVATSKPGDDELPGVLAVMAGRVGFEFRAPAHDEPRRPLFDRLEAYAVASRFRFREIALDSTWWKREAPPFIGFDAKTGTPLALAFWRRHWRRIDPETLAETLIDAAAAAQIKRDGFALYPSLPDRPTTGDVWRFSIFAVTGDVRTLLITSAAASLAGLLMPVATGAILGVAIPDGRFTLLGDMLLLLLATTLGSTGFQIARAMTLVRLGTYIDQRLQAAIWDRVLRLRTSFFRGYSVGDLTWRILGIDSIRRILTGQSINAIIGGAFSLTSLGIMLIYDAELAAFALVYAFVAGGLLFAVGRVQKRLKQQAYNGTGLVSGLLIELIGGIAKLRVAAAELRAFSRWSAAFAEQRLSSAGALSMNAIQTIAATSLPIIGALFVFAIAGGRSHPIDVASFAAFNSAFGLFTAAILNLAIALNASIDVLGLYDRLRPVLEAPLEVEHDRADPGELSGAIAIRDLWFRYAENGPWVLESLNLDVRPGESVAIVGTSGSGKSTVLRLLLGLESPTRGGIYYDGNDLKDLDLRLVRRQIGSVLEESTLFPGSLYENIAGSAPIARERVLEAVRQAGLEKDIAAMPMGLASAVSESGVQISGGQRQRVIIARALVNRPRLLFFDEATSALDNRTQEIVRQSLEKMNATRIIVAHRLSTIRDADRILVLEGGRIVESGTYDELIAKGGAFLHLARRQLL